FHQKPSAREPCCLRCCDTAWRPRRTEDSACRSGGSAIHLPETKGGPGDCLRASQVSTRICPEDTEDCCRSRQRPRSCSLDRAGVDSRARIARCTEKPY